MNQLEAERAIYFSYNPTDIKGISLRLTENNFSNLLDELADQLIANGLLLNKVDERFYVVKKESSRFVKFVIRDGETNELLPYAMLRLEQTDLGKVADLNGELNIIVDRPSTAILNITFLGFEDQRIAVDSLADLSVHEVFMQPVTTALTQIEVKEYLNVGIASDPIASSFKIFPHSMEIIPGLSERDVLLSAQMIAGFASNDESAAGINLRGSARDNTLLYWNNIPIYHTAHYFGHISSFIPSSIGEMNLYKNYIPVKYGGAAAGIIDHTNYLTISYDRDTDFTQAMLIIDHIATILCGIRDDQRLPFLRHMTYNTMAQRYADGILYFSILGLFRSISSQLFEASLFFVQQVNHTVFETKAVDHVFRDFPSDALNRFIVQ